MEMTMLESAMAEIALWEIFAQARGANATDITLQRIKGIPPRN